MAKLWVMLFCGFLQKDGDVNGMVTLWDRLRRKYSSHDVIVERHSWYTNASDLAEMINRIHVEDIEKPEIVVIGYSWGGTTSLNFARELGKRGLRVSRMVLSDAVYRPWLPLGYSLAFCPCVTLKVPPSVKRVTAYRQRTNWPRGHRLVAKNYLVTDIDTPVFLPNDHIHMGNAIEFHQCAMNVVGESVSKLVG